MCEFCHQHGEGKKWYLQAKNYSDDLLNDARRRRFIEEFISDPGSLARGARGIERLARAPRFLRGVVGRLITRRMKKVHFGQVVPVEEIEEILGFTNSVVRLACMCRHVTLGREKRYCYGISLAPDGGQLGEILRGVDSSFLTGPADAGLEMLSREEAILAMHDHEKEGLCHTIWTFHTPFIAGICNCDRSDCLAMRTTLTHAVPVMFRAEYVAGVIPEACVGCRECERVCQFGAITFSGAQKRAVIDRSRCYGCGVCRAVCSSGAIRLEERAAVPETANLW